MTSPTSRSAIIEADGGCLNSPASRPLQRYQSIRSWTETLCDPLIAEDYVVQSMPDASPAKWHLAHTTWFFETLLLVPHLPGYRPLESQYKVLFNSYYNTLGEQFTRSQRGLLSRPSVAEVIDYRHHVDQHMQALLADLGESPQGEILALLEVGLNHEQQHQELMLTDLKHMFSLNPLHPVYRPYSAAPSEAIAELAWHGFEENLHWIGTPVESSFDDSNADDSIAADSNAADSNFAYDNEGPRHRVFVEAFRIASRLITNGEYLEFMADDGYGRHELWLSDGWATVQEHGWRAPLYWRQEEDGWKSHTLGGLRPIHPEEPVCHVSLYEADAFARWKGARLPSEAEWEVAVAQLLGPGAAVGETADDANFVEDGFYHPRPLAAEATHGQFLGDVWEWTASAYSSYPGYRPPAGPLGEYNSKFMNNQTILRGGSCATPRSHIRSTYRNFFPPHIRWQFSGIRLAQDGMGR